MALLSLNFFAESLRSNTTVTVILPAKRSDGRPCQSLYLHHGGGESDHTSWYRNFPVERLASIYNLAVIMPYTPSRYKLTDMEHGEKWFTFAAGELPDIMVNMFNLSKRREDTFAAGYSGGGYNALKLGLRRPDRFGAVASASPALLCQRFVEQGGNTSRSGELRWIFGDPVPAGDDGYLMLEAAAGIEPKTKIFLCCGAEDGLLSYATDFRDRALELGFDLTWRQTAGAHTWENINEALPLMFDSLPLQKL